MGGSRYRIELDQRVTPGIAAAFPELELERTPQGRTLVGDVRDEATLYGLLDRLFVLGLTVRAVEELER